MDKTIVDLLNAIQEALPQYCVEFVKVFGSGNSFFDIAITDGDIVTIRQVKEYAFTDDGLRQYVNSVIKLMLKAGG